MRQIFAVSWLQLTHNKSRLFISVVGVVFSVVLMFVMMGIRDAIYEDAVTIHKVLQADLFIQPYEVEYFFALPARAFPGRILYSMSALDGVESVAPFYIEWGLLQSTETLEKKSIAICAFQLDKPIFAIPSINQQVKVLQESNTFLFDRLARSGYGPIPELVEKNSSTIVNLSGRNTNIRGLFEIGGGILSVNGLLVTSDSNYSAFFNAPLGRVNMGLVTVQPGADIEKVKAAIAAKLPDGIDVITKEEFIETEKDYWRTGSPIGFIFNVVASIALFVGGIIVYQILFTQISDYLSIYATFKAIGYNDNFLIATVLQEGVIMSVMGYIPGFIICSYSYQYIEAGTRLPVTMTLERCILVLLLTLVMCFLAGILSIRKLREADPAELFR
jgi:putative ABC transport system permease protein